MSATRCVPQTTHTKGNKYSCGTVVITENSRKAYRCVSTVAMCKLLTIFTHILNNKSKKTDKLKTAERNKIFRKLLSKMPIICVNRASILHTQFNSRVVTKVSTAHCQYVVTECLLSSGKNQKLCKLCNVLCVKKVKDEYVY
jgi:hypothetical protein